FRAKDNSDAMDHPIVLKWNPPITQGPPIQLDLADSACHVFRILYREVKNRRAPPVTKVESMPMRRDHRIQGDNVSANGKAQYLLDPDPIHPSRGACVPGPASAPYLALQCVNVRNGDVRLYLVPLNICRFPGVLDRVHRGQYLNRHGSISPTGICHWSPERAV